MTASGLSSIRFLTEWACSASEVMLAVMSQHTTTMRLGFGVVLLPVHHPLHVAAKVATLDVMSGGRVDVGVGRSGNPYQLTPFGVKLEETRDRWEEALSILPRMWTEQVFSHEEILPDSTPRVIPSPCSNRIRRCFRPAARTIPSSAPVS